MSQAKEKAALALTNAQRKYQDAYEAGDAKAMAEAQAEIAQAAVQKQQVERWTPPQKNQEESLQQQQKPVYSQPSERNAFTPDPEAVSWAEKNEWFHTNDEMTGFAYGVHDSLINKGIDPVIDADRYYATIDKRIREKFPEHFESEQPRKRDKAPTVVAPVHRTVRGNKVVLTKSQLAIAERLGITPQRYAAEVAKMESQQ